MNFINGSGESFKITFEGVFSSPDGLNFALKEKVLLLTGMIIVIPLLSLVAILLFKNRKIQMFIVMSVIVFASGLFATYCYTVYSVITEYKSSVIPGLKMVIPIFILIFSYLAYVGIRNDDRLVKSYDRLR